jgi:hypothetical protein
MALGSTQPLREMSIMNLPGDKRRSARKADCLENVGASTSHNPMGLQGLLQGQLYFYSLFVQRGCHFRLTRTALHTLQHAIKWRCKQSARQCGVNGLNSSQPARCKAINETADN